MYLYVCECMYVCMYIRMFVCVYVRVCSVLAYKHVYANVCCMFLRVCVYVPNIVVHGSFLYVV